MPKRRFQKGCIRKETKQWVLYYWMDVNQDGVIRRVKRSARLGEVSLSQRAAEKAAQPILDSVNSQTVVPVVTMNRGLTLKDYVPEWRKFVAPALKPSTIKGRESSLRAHLLPILGDVPLTGMTVNRIQDLITSMKSRKKTRENVVTDLFSMLTSARKRQHAVSPPVKLSDLYFPADETESEPFSFTPDQMRRILKLASERTPWNLFFMLLPLSGIRSGEILGLPVCALDFEQNLIHIRQSCWQGRIQTVKTKGSKNSIPMTSAVRAKLLEYLPSHKHELLFVNRNGRPYSRDKVVSKVLHPMLKKLGINHKGRRCGLQAFRHGLASLLVSTASAKVAQRQLRHSDAATTLGIYAHIIGNDHIEAMERVQSVLIGTSGKSQVSTGS